MSNIANHPDFQRKLPAAQEALTLPPRLNNYDTPPANAPSSSMYAPDYLPTKEGTTQRDEAPPTRGKSRLCGRTEIYTKLLIYNGINEVLTELAGTVMQVGSRALKSPVIPWHDIIRSNS